MSNDSILVHQLGFSTWAMYFASITAIQYHPANNKPDCVRMSLEECACVADDMLNLTLARWQSCP